MKTRNYSIHCQSWRKDPPQLPVGGASRMLRGLMLHRRAVLGTPKCEKSVGRRGSAPDPAGGAYSAPPDPLAGGEGLRGGFAAPSSITPLTILSLCLSCVYVHTCMKMHCYVLMNVNHGASQLYLGGASNYLAPALFIACATVYQRLLKKCAWP